MCKAKLKARVRHVSDREIEVPGIAGGGEIWHDLQQRLWSIPWAVTGCGVAGGCKFLLYRMRNVFQFEIIPASGSDAAGLVSF